MASLRDLGGFSVFMLGHRMLYYLQTNGDRFLIGRFLGTSALGTYAIAFNTILQPASKIGGPLQRVMSPAFCRIQDEPERIAVAWARVVRILASVSVAPLAALVVLAPDFVPVVLGHQWDAAIPVIQILAWVGIVQALQSLSVDVLMARDRARTIFRFSVVLVTCHLVAFAVGLNWGVVGVSVAFAVSTTLVEPWQTILAARALGVSPMIFLREHLRGVPGRRGHVPGGARRARRARGRGSPRGGAPGRLHRGGRGGLRGPLRLAGAGAQARAAGCAPAARIGPAPHRPCRCRRVLIRQHRLHPGHGPSRFGSLAR